METRNVRFLSFVFSVKFISTWYLWLLPANVDKKKYNMLFFLKKKKFIYIADWIYENMASVGVYRSYAKCVLGTKTLTLPTQDNEWLSAPPTELCNYHDNNSQQRPDLAG